MFQRSTFNLSLKSFRIAGKREDGLDDGLSEEDNVLASVLAEDSASGP